MTLAKRLMDIGLALLLVIALAVPILVIALWVLVVDGRPVFYPSERMKTPDTPFTLWKFRTMRTFECQLDGLYGHRRNPVNGEESVYSSGIYQLWSDGNATTIPRV